MNSKELEEYTLNEMKKFAENDYEFEICEGIMKISRIEDLEEGAAIRIMHSQFGTWIPGWWQEIVKKTGSRVLLRDLISGEEEERDIEQNLGNVWMHSKPNLLKDISKGESEGIKKYLKDLRTHYENIVFKDKELNELIQLLKNEVAWFIENDEYYYDMEEEFEIRRIAIKKIGIELNERGGRTLMLDVYKKSGSHRFLERAWDSIGEWYG